MKKLDTEVCAYSIESCRAAKQGGATRVELCAGPAEGGVTPSAATIKLARKIDGLQLSVMVRPRGGDFLYSAEEFEQMKEDLLFIKDCGADYAVFGLLTADGNVDILRTKELVDLAAPMKVTFHRAFDMVADWEKALEDVVSAGCHRILTSGCRNTAVEGIETLKKLVNKADGRIEIMAGSGVRPVNAEILARTGVDALHFSAKTTRDSDMKFRNPNVSMGGNESVGEYDIEYADPAQIAQIVNILKEIR